MHRSTGRPAGGDAFEGGFPDEIWLARDLLVTTDSKGSYDEVEMCSRKSLIVCRTFVYHIEMMWLVDARNGFLRSLS